MNVDVETLNSIQTKGQSVTMFDRSSGSVVPDADIGDALLGVVLKGDV